MWETTSGHKAFANEGIGDQDIKDKILSGIRPQVVEGTPYLYAQLMKNCWHHDRKLRPSAKHIIEVLESKEFRVSMLHANNKKQGDTIDKISSGAIPTKEIGSKSHFKGL